MNNRKSLLLAIGLAVVLAGCRQSAAQTEAGQMASAPNVAASTAHALVAPAKNLLEDRETLEAAQLSLQQLPELAGKPIYVYGNIDFFDGTQPRIELSVQNPNREDDLWFLRYEHGKWTMPDMSNAPEEVLPKPITPHLTPLQDIHFVDVADVAQLWRTKAVEVKAVWQEPFFVSFVWMPKLKKRFWHTAELDAVGAQYYLSVNTDGTIWEWKKL